MFDVQSLSDIHGFMTPNELMLLNRLASEVQPTGTIVEIGSFQGLSTLALAKGAAPNNAAVWAIDPHHEYDVNTSTHYGMNNHARLLENITRHNAGATVRVVALPSVDVARIWKYEIDLLWIDGSHEYEDVIADFMAWSPYVVGKIAMHDTSGNWPGVSRALSEILAGELCEVCERADSITILKQKGSNG